MLFGDGGRIRLQQSQIAIIRSTDEAIGGADTIEGNEAGDVIVGGAGSDRLFGESETVSLTSAGKAGSDIILGDNGELTWILGSDTVTGRPDVSTVTLDTSIATLDRITTTSPTAGGDDFIKGNGAGDLILGGTGRDTIYGDSSDAAAQPDGPDGNDLIFGDHGKIYLTAGLTALPGSALYNNFFFSIDTSSASAGAADVVFGNAGNDIVIGGQGDDLLFGGKGSDDLIGGHNISGALGGAAEPGHDELDPLDVAARLALSAEIAAFSGGAASLGARLSDLNPLDVHEISEILDGGEGDDALIGDNGIIIRKDANFLTGVGAADLGSPRFRTVGPEGLYVPVTVDPGGLLAANGAPGITVGFNANVTSAPRANVDMDVVRGITVLDQSVTIASAALAAPSNARPFGNDIIVGGAGDDEAFGGLGDDIIQGDGRVVMLAGNAATVQPGDTLPPLQAPSFNARVFTAVGLGTFTTRIEISENADDGNDYIEGNGGNDRIYGNLGSDDLIGGSSSLFGNSAAGQRMDGADLIFGGAGNPAQLARNADASASSLIAANDRHAADSDVISGDNANIYRIVDASGRPVRFSYDNPAFDGYNAAHGIAVRAVQLIDYGYVLTGPAPNERFIFTGVGAGDLIYGESGDDVIFGQTGDDLLFGNGEDDDIVGGHGADFILAGTGNDGILGDDGIIATARVPVPLAGTTLMQAEALFNISFATADINRVISSPADALIDRINLQGTIEKTAWLANFRVDDIERTGTSFDDIIFGGLGTDSIHGGDGDDAISGAEALPFYYDATGASGGFAEVNAFLVKQQQIGKFNDPAVSDKPFWFNFAPVNPGHVLDYQGNYDGSKATATKVSEFAYYDENAPRRAIKLDPLTAAPLTTSAAGMRDFLLNFNAGEGPSDIRWTGATAGSAARPTDGDDRIFGDLGNDWLVGGSGRDHMYGGYGDDLLNMDDDHTSATVQPNGQPGKNIAGNLENNAADDYQSYADISYGGAGRDVLILNSGFDRAVDWTGEFNSFVVPFSPFGEPSVTRSLNPKVEEFLLVLSAADGADQHLPDGKLFIDQKRASSKLNAPDATRHYEPFAELGMVRPQDADWNAQHGGPADPQAGNLPGVQRDVRARAIEDIPVLPAGAAAFSVPPGGQASFALSVSVAPPVSPAPSPPVVDPVLIQIDWAGTTLDTPLVNFGSRTSAAAKAEIASALPTFIFVQSVLAGDSSVPAPINGK